MGLDVDASRRNLVAQLHSTKLLARKRDLESYLSSPVPVLGVSVPQLGAIASAFRKEQRILYDEEFWVQRAVGTWLRECWKKDRRRTEAFLRRHVRGLPKS